MLANRVKYVSFKLIQIICVFFSLSRFVRTKIFLYGFKWYVCEYINHYIMYNVVMFILLAH